MLGYSYFMFLSKYVANLYLKTITPTNDIREKLKKQSQASFLLKLSIKLYFQTTLGNGTNTRESEIWSRILKQATKRHRYSKRLTIQAAWIVG